jgi:hypothetical protein
MSVELCIALCWHLASRRAVEDGPHGEVVGEILEPVLDSCSHEYKVSGLELIPAAIVKQDAASTRDGVNLVLCMRRCRFGDTGSESNARTVPRCMTVTKCEPGGPGMSF